MKGSDRLSKLLIIAYSFPPTNHAGVYRVLSFSNYFGESDVDVHVVTTQPGNHNVDNNLNDKLGKNITVYRTKEFQLSKIQGRSLMIKFFAKFWNFAIRNINSRLLPFDSHFFWIFTAFFAARRVLKKEDIETILVSSPPHSSQIVGWLLKKMYPIKLVVDFRDAWTHNQGNRLFGIKPSRLEICAETKVLTKADLIIANTPTNKCLLEADFPFVKGKVEVIPNGFFPENEGAEEQNVNAEDGEKFVLTYTGEFYGGMSESIFKALGILKKKHPDLGEKFRFDLAGLVYDEDHMRIEQWQLQDSVKYHGFVSYKSAEQLARNADVVLYVLPDVPEADNWVPSKLYFYIGLRKPILAIAPPGDAVNIIKDVNAGYTMSPKDIEGISNLIESWVYGGKSFLLDYNESARDKYSRQRQAKQLLKLLHDLQ